MAHLSEKDTILISHLGYKRLNLPLSVFLETLNKNQNKIFLEENPLVLKEIKVLGDKINLQAYAYENKTKPVLPKFFVFFTNNSNLGLEIARKIDVKQKGSFLIKSVSLEIGLNEYESRVMRMKFYSLSSDLPDKLLIEKDIIFRIINKQKEFTIDVSDYDIWFNDDFVVSFELIEPLDPSIGFGFTVGKFSNNNIYHRDASLGKWRKRKSSMGLACSVVIMQ